MSNKLFVGNLSWTTTDGILQDAFAPFGTVSEAAVMMDKFTGKSRGFAFVTMGSPDEAEAAVKGMDGKEIDGRPVRVSIARPKEERAPGSGGGFRGGGGFRRGLLHVSLRSADRAVIADQAAACGGKATGRFFRRSPRAGRRPL